MNSWLGLENKQAECVVVQGLHLDQCSVVGCKGAHLTFNNLFADFQERYIRVVEVVGREQIITTTKEKTVMECGLLCLRSDECTSIKVFSEKSLSDSLEYKCILLKRRI